jgi:hypothetical protein
MYAKHIYIRMLLLCLYICTLRLLLLVNFSIHILYQYTARSWFVEQDGMPVGGGHPMTESTNAAVLNTVHLSQWQAKQTVHAAAEI